jgi:hypothetical protein
MFLFIDSSVALNLCDVANGLFVFAEGEEYFFYFMLIEVDVGIHSDVLNNIAFEFKRVNRFAFGVWNEGFNLGLIGASHRLYYLGRINI